MASPASDLTRAVAALGGDIGGALEELRVPAVVVDRDAVVRWLNARARELFGDVLGHPLLELVAPESSHAVRLQFSKKLLGTARATDYEVTMRSASGSQVPVQVSTVAIDGSDHRVVGVFGITRVKTEPKSPPAHLPRRGLTPRQQ